VANLLIYTPRLIKKRLNEKLLVQLSDNDFYEMHLFSLVFFLRIFFEDFHVII